MTRTGSGSLVVDLSSLCRDRRFPKAGMNAGNLALVSVSTNSKFSNSLPRAKAENYRTTIEMQSPKLKQMAVMTRAEGWGDEQVRRHHDEALRLLVQDLATGQ